MNEPLISVVVCTHNRAGLLAACLASLERQQLASEHFEIIVIDDDSQDDTPALVAARAQRMPQLRYARERLRNLSLARNRGCQMARGLYVAYLDDDAQAPPEHLACARQVIVQHDPDLLAGPIYPYYSSPKPRWFKDKYETKKFAEVSGFSQTCRITGANFMIKRNLLLRLGQFDPDHGMQGGRYVIGDERKVLEQYRACTPPERQKVYYALECYVRHHVPAHKMTVRSILARHFTGGRTMVRIFRDVKGQRPSGRNLLRQACRWPGRLARSLAREARRPEQQEADFVQALALAWYDLGWIVEGSRQVWLHRIGPLHSLTHTGARSPGQSGVIGKR